MTGTRMDKWLWAARFFKTRALASKAERKAMFAADLMPAERPTKRDRRQINRVRGR